MTISYPVTPPASPVPAAIELVPTSTTGVSISPYTAQHQVYQYPAAVWRMSVTLPPMTRSAAEPWIAFLLSLNGRAGTFTMGDVTGRVPRGTVPGTPVVNGASQTGATLATTGWTASQTGVLLAGDYIQVGTNLYRNLTDADSDGSGQATLDIWPRLRTSPADTAAITTSNTTGIWRLLSDEMPYQPGNPFYRVAFSCIEAL